MVSQIYGVHPPAEPPRGRKREQGIASLMRDGVRGMRMVLSLVL